MPGETIAGRYHLERALGHGAMSSVWLAEDAELGRRVAVKVLGPEADRARFDREARAAASLAHPNICQLYDYGEDGGRPYMVLEHLSGGTLEDRLVRGSLPDEDAERIAFEVASGLAHAHGRGLVHRDLKPANVLFDDEGRAKIADFGIARMGGAGTLTEAGTVLGTAAYISPEQAAGETATPASDVYSYGVILYRMLAGRLPFEAASAIELVQMHQRAVPPPLSRFREDAPARLASLASATLAKNPADRPADGAALVAELGGVPPTVALPLAGAPTQVIPRAHPARRRPVALPLVVAALGILVAAGVALAIVATQTGGSSGPSRPTTLPSLGITTATSAATAPATATTAATSAQQTTTRQTTTHDTIPATTIAPPRTAPVTTAPPPPPATTAPPPPTTTAPPPTTTAGTTTITAP